MKRFGLILFALAVALLYSVQPAFAGLTVAFSADGNPVPAFSFSDSNTPSQNGNVSGIGGFVDFDGDSTIDIVIQTLSATSSKTPASGSISTVSLSLTALRDIDLEIRVSDLFAVPATVPGTPLSVVSSLLPLTGGGGPITLETYVDGNLGATVTSPGPATGTGGAVTSSFPFLLESLILYSLQAGDSVNVVAESLVTPVPEAASLIVWSALGGFALVGYAARSFRAR